MTHIFKGEENMSRTVRRLRAIIAGAAVALIASTVVVPLAAEPAGAATFVRAWLTTPDLSQRLTQQPDVTLTPAAPGATLTMDSAQRFQTIEGYGSSFTDTATWLLGTHLNATARAQVISDLFTTAGGGIGLSLARAPMGASDFAVDGVYSYADTPSSDALPGFSTAHDDAYVIPVITAAQAANPNLKLIMNPWSPPAWMKTNDSMLGGWNGATLRSDKYTALANYFVRTLQEYQAKGVAVWAVTPGNEPNIDPASYPAMYLTAANQASFIANNLGPALTNAGLTTKILGGDSSIADVPFAQTLFANPAAANRLAGTAWHCYQDDVGFASGLSQIRALRPTLPFYISECSTGPTGIAGNTTAKTLIASNNGASGMILWNLALDRNGGPKMGVGCDGCTGLVTIDPASGEYEYTINYYELGQFSKFVRPGAQRVASTDGAGIWAQAYRNTDGTKAIVAYNTNSTATTFTVNWDGENNFSYTLPAKATVTFTTVATTEGAFSLRGVHSNRCLDVPNGATGVQVQIWDCVGNANQRITETSAGELRVAGRCLAANGNGTTPGTRLILWPCNGTASQLWTFNADGTITNRLSGLVIDVAGWATANGSPVQLWTRLGNNTQRFTRV
jgi:glucosylceramidase